MYTLLVVEVDTYNQSVKVTLIQIGLTKKVLNIMGMLDSNSKTTPEAIMPLVIDADGNTFDEPL